MLIPTVLLHVILIASFIVIFFFTYGSKIEGDIVKNQCTEIVNDLMGDIHTVIPEEDRAALHNTIEPLLQAPDMTKLDAEVKEANEKLMQKTIKLIMIVFAIGVGFIAALWVVFRFSVKDLVVHSFLSLFFVAITEYVFLTYFAKNYITIDSNYIKYRALNTLANYRQPNAI